MEIQEIAASVDSLKLISGCFALIMGLLVYIWKTDKARTEKMDERNEKMFERINDTLSELKELTARHDVKIENLEK